MYNTFHSAFASKALKVAGSTLDFCYFPPRVSELVSRILWQGGKVQKCHSFLKKKKKNPQEVFSKFDNGVSYLIR